MQIFFALICNLLLALESVNESLHFAFWAIVKLFFLQVFSTFVNFFQLLCYKPEQFTAM